MTTTTKRLWINQNGRAVCDAHGGGYLRRAIAQWPDAKHHTTPLDDWQAFTDPDDLEGIACEDCPTEEQTR